MPAHTYRLDQAVSENRLLVATVVLSFIGHMLFFVILIYGPSQFASKRYIPTIVNVSLVSLPAPGPPGASGGTTVAKEEPKAQKAVPKKIGIKS